MCCLGKMNKFETFSILLHKNASCVYNAGEKIEGSVRVVLKKSMKIRGILVKLTGKAELEWSENSVQIGYNPTYYKNHETYIDLAIILFGQGPNSNKQIELLEGEHKFPFKFHLPVNIPSSFEHKYGKIKYLLKAVIDKPWTFDYIREIPLTVKSALDLNTQYEAKARIDKRSSTNFGCLSCKSGSISAVVYLNKSGYIPGDKINIKLNINNSSNQTIAYSMVTLVKKIIFHAKKKTKTKKISETFVRSRCPVKPGEFGSWKGKCLEIPSLCSPQLIYCSIMDIEYWLIFSVCSNWRTFLEIPIKIIMGTIPLKETIPEQPIAGSTPRTESPKPKVSN